MLVFKDEMAIMDRTAIKGRRIIIPASLQEEAINQLHVNYVGIEKTGMLACKSIYWINMNADIEEAIKSYSTCLDHQVT